ncbi:hypothetical protein FBBAL38_02975 [Flavobacteria bacterium BAL38]|nr:hypothetical protein FBBAL38_02975 [Flavobacteria bacterium BAL38]
MTDFNFKRKFQDIYFKDFLKPHRNIEKEEFHSQ